MMKIFDKVLSTFLEKKIETIATLLEIGALVKWGNSIGVLLQSLKPIYLALIVFLLLISLTVSLVLLFKKRNIFIEWKGSYFKPNKFGGVHEVVYCGKCKTSTSTGSGIPLDYENFKCTPRCGWVSSFTYRDFKKFIKEKNS